MKIETVDIIDGNYPVVTLVPEDAGKEMVMQGEDLIPLTGESVILIGIQDQDIELIKDGDQEVLDKYVKPVDDVGTWQIEGCIGAVVMKDDTFVESESKQIAEW